MTPEEALQYQRAGGLLAEPVSSRDLHLLDVDLYFQKRGTIVVMTSIPATNPMHEHGTSPEHHAEAVAAARSGRIVRKVL